MFCVFCKFGSFVSDRVCQKLNFSVSLAGVEPAPWVFFLCTDGTSCVLFLFHPRSGGPCAEGRMTLSRPPPTIPLSPHLLLGSPSTSPCPAGPHRHRILRSSVPSKCTNFPGCRRCDALLTAYQPPPPPKQHEPRVQGQHWLIVGLVSEHWLRHRRIFFPFVSTVSVRTGIPHYLYFCKGSYRQWLEGLHPWFYLEAFLDFFQKDINASYGNCFKTWHLLLSLRTFFPFLKCKFKIIVLLLLIQRPDLRNGAMARQNWFFCSCLATTCCSLCWWFHRRGPRAVYRRQWEACVPVTKEHCLWGNVPMHARVHGHLCVCLRVYTSKDHVCKTQSFHQFPSQFFLN